MDFAVKLSQAVKRNDSISVARQLSFQSVQSWTASDLHTLSMHLVVEAGIKPLFTESSWGDVALAHWHKIRQVSQGDLVGAHRCQNTLLTLLNRTAEKTDNWVLPVMYAAARELRVLATEAFKALAKEPNQDKSSELTKQMEEATRTVNRSFNLCLNDRNLNLDLSKKWGVYYFMGELFKSYFKLQKQPLAKSVIKVHNAKVKELPALKQFPASHRVTFYYYSGVLQFIDGNFEEAETQLVEALRLVGTSYLKQAESILLYLIPCRLIIHSKAPRVANGIKRPLVPSKDLWNRFPRLEAAYRDLIRYSGEGNIRAYDEALLERRQLFVSKFLYLAVERVRALAVYHLVYRVFVMQDRSNRLVVSTLRAALDTAGYYDEFRTDSPNTEDELDEAECLVATLISEGLVKGYISHERRTVVLSNKDAFPFA